jgi:hypothetical protein
MEHHICTVFGDSKGSYGNNQTLPPPQGILQGNGTGPAGWSTISAVIIKAMQDQGYGYSSWSLIWQKAMTLVCFTIVDDTDLTHAPTDQSIPTQQVIQQAQEALSLWEGLLHTTGGASTGKKFLVPARGHPHEGQMKVCPGSSMSWFSVLKQWNN